MVQVENCTHLCSGLKHSFVCSFMWSFIWLFISSFVYVIIIWEGKSECSDWFFLGQDFTIGTVSMEMVIGCVCFWFSKAGKFKTSVA